MKSLVRGFVINIFSLWLTTEIIAGFKIGGRVEMLIFAAFVFALLNTFAKPFLKLLFLPINLLTLGAFSWLINVLILYLLTYLIAPISVSSWQFPGFSYQGFIIPKITFGVLETYILGSFVISLISNFLKWL